MYCVDCKKNVSTHASVTFGIFLCHTCATLHISELGMGRSYVKSLTENWDAYQLKFLDPTKSGNKKCFEYFK